MKLGIKGEQHVTVNENNTANALGSGTLEVFATPAMIALIEETAWKSVAPYLEEGEGTVGTLLNIKHLSATPVGVTVKCETELIEQDGRRLVFKAAVYDAQGLIGEGTHERFIISNQRFINKANAKKDNA